MSERPLSGRGRARLRPSRGRIARPHPKHPATRSPEPFGIDDLPKPLARALEPVIREARRSGIRIALVGGIVRDLLRGEETGRDVDLLVEGDAAALAHRVALSGKAQAAARPIRIRIHRRFGTATIEGPGTIEGAPNGRIDLAGARRERYSKPGALPEVERATLEEDLARRDFTVNAIAFELGRPARGSGGARGGLHDPFGGAADLAARRLRVLHPRSFEDDPTRMLRAVRYANRMGFTLEPSTRRLLKSALASGALETVSGDRLRRELVKIFSERGWLGAGRLADSLGILRSLVPSWRLTPRLWGALRRAESLAARAPRSGASGEDRHTWMIPLLVASADLDGRSRRRLAEQLALAGDELRIFEKGSAEAGVGGGEGSSPRPGARVRESREDAIARAALAPAGALRQKAEAGLLAPVRISIRGSDLIQAGIPAGPAVGRALDRTRRALEEGRIAPREELEFAVAAARDDRGER